MVWTVLGLVWLALSVAFCLWFFRDDAMDRAKADRLTVELDVEMFAGAELYWGSEGEVRSGCWLVADDGKDLCSQTGRLECGNSQALGFAQGYFAAFLVQVETIFNVEMVENLEKLDELEAGKAEVVEESAEGLLVFED